jgi:hypothetical protein
MAHFYKQIIFLQYCTATARTVPMLFPKVVVGSLLLPPACRPGSLLLHENKVLLVMYEVYFIK